MTFNRLAVTFFAASVLAAAPSITHAQERPHWRPGQPEVLAQAYAPPSEIPGAPGAGDQPGANDVASLLVRIDRLEDQVRTLNGEIQTLQNNQQQLQQALQKFQRDVDFRFQDLKGGGSDSSRYRQRTEDASPSRRNDAFNPADHPNAIGAPRSLGQLNGPSPADGGSSGLSGEGGDAGVRSNPTGAPLQLDGSPQDDDTQADNSASATPSQGGSVMAALPPSNPREDFDLALVSFHNGQYDQARSGFEGFLLRHPRDRLAPDALFYLGESYWKMGRTADAARQYLKVSTVYGSSPHAPEALLKLGLSLEKLGSPAQACASFAQIERKYPNASAAIRASASREMKRNKC